VLIDLSLIAFAYGLIGWTLRLRYPDAGALEQTMSNVAVLVLPAVVLLSWLIFQGTPGKLLSGCRIVDAESGGRARPFQLVLRLIGYAISLAPAGLGFLWMLWDRRGQGWHDKLARTQVVEDDDAAKSLDQLSAELR
jgi:uncharacterized RDD family membrane protein YckC